MMFPIAKLRSTTRSSRRVSRRGATTVEFALTAPLLFLILFGSLELSHANMVFNVTEAAAFEGAREGIVPGATAAECQAAAQRILGISKISGANVTVNPGNLNTSTQSIVVTITVPYARNTIVTPFFTNGLQIQRSCTLDREQL